MLYAACPALLFIARLHLLYCDKKKIVCEEDKKHADNCCQLHVSALLASSAVTVSAGVVVSTFRVETGDIKEIRVGHFTFAACAGPKVEVESRAAGGSVVVPVSCVVCVARFG